MIFSDQSIEEFIEIWQSEFDALLTPDQARREAARLMEVYWLLAQPLPGEPGHALGREAEPLP